MLIPAIHRARHVVRELKRRRVFRSTGVYVVMAFAGLQGADILVPALHLPGWTMTVLVVLALAGLPVAVGLSWVFDVVPGPGVRRTEPAGGPGGTPPPRAGEGVGDAAANGAGAPALPAGLIPAAGGAALPTVAVLPFLNLGGGADDAVFADGITEDVILHLAKVRALQVISRTSVLPFRKRELGIRQVAERLNASAILDGSVRRVGDRVRIVAELVDAGSERHLWGDTYDRRLTDIFAIQTDVALRIASALQAELSSDERRRIGREPTTSLASYQLYLKGHHWLIRYTPASMRRALDFFRQAIEEDPTYALAHVAIAIAYAELAEEGAMSPEEARPGAVAAVEEALRIDPSLGEAHCTRAHLACIWSFDWDGAEAGFRRALELSPNGSDVWDLYGRMCMAVGRLEEALALQRRAQELDPLAHRIGVATTLLRSGRWAEAEEEAARAVDFDPDHDRAHATLGWARLLQGRVEVGLEELEKAVALTPENGQWLAQLGQARAMAGDRAGARDVLRRLEDRGGWVAPYHLAYVHTGLGERERALDLLETAFEERSGGVYAIAASFLFEPLREEPRFQALLERMGLGGTGRAGHETAVGSGVGGAPGA